VLYDLASVVDDHLMGITHILRGDTWLSTTPVHLAMFRALGWVPPAFGHLPQIVGTDRRKLAKREGAASLGSLLGRGYLPEALVNFLALLGWSPGAEGDVLTLADLVAHFDLGHVQRSPAVFNPARLDWLNGVHLRHLAPADLAQRCLPYLEAAGLVHATTLDEAGWDRLVRAVSLHQDRMRTLLEASDLLTYIYRVPGVDRTQLLAQCNPDEARIMLGEARQLLATSAFTEPDLESGLRGLAQQRGYRTHTLFGLLRVAVTGRTAAPPLFGLLAVVGREAVLDRLGRAETALAAAATA
jgi:glutamyl-tRNA synthetase